MAQNTCPACKVSFNSERELQEHQQNAHSQSGGASSDSEQNRGEQDNKTTSAKNCVTVIRCA